MLFTRNNDKYGTYKTSIDGVGECTLVLDVCDFGESLLVTDKHENTIFYGEFLEGIEEDYTETEEAFYFLSTELCKGIEVKKSDIHKV